MKIWIDANPMKPMFHDAPRAYLALPVGDVYSDIIAVELEGAEGLVLADRRELEHILEIEFGGRWSCRWPTCRYYAITLDPIPPVHPHSGTCPLREEKS